MTSSRHDSRAIVVTVPKCELGYVLQEKFTFTGTIYWRLPRIPAHPVERVYFVWDGAVRAWRDVLRFDLADPETPLVWLTSEHHKIDPLPMPSFQGYRWFEPHEASR